MSGADIAKNNKEIKQFLNEQNANISNAYKSFDTLAKDKEFKNNMNQIQTTVGNFSEIINTKKTNEKVTEITNNLNNINSGIKNFNQQISKVKNREVEYVSDINNSLQKTTKDMQGLIDFTKDKFKSAKDTSKN